jgi:Spy/CpxP family protein refolding chaperone
MKSKFVTSFGLAGLLLAGSLATTAIAQVPAAGDGKDQATERPERGRFGRHGARFGKHGRGGMFGRGLDLTDEQRTQVRTIVEGERAKTATLREQLAANHTATREATKAGRFDEAQIRALAQERANIMTELAVSRARIQASIYNSVLTADQKAKLEQMSTERSTKRAERKERREQRREQRDN